MIWLGILIGAILGGGFVSLLASFKISDLYAEIDYLKRTGEGFINEPVEEVK